MSPEELEQREELLKVERLVEQSRKAYKRRKDKVSEDYLSLNISLSKEIHRRKLITPFKTYLALKFADRSGSLPLEDAADRAADILGYKDSRATSAAIQQCIELKWMHTDGKTLFVKAFHSLERRYKVEFRTGGVFRQSDLSDYREWVFAHVFGSRCKNFQKVQTKGWAKKFSKSYTNSREVSITIIADELNLSRSAACRLKKRAAKMGYIKAKNRREQLGIKPDDRNLASKYLDDPGLFIEGGEVFRRLTDWLTFNWQEPGNLRLLHFTRRPSCYNI